MLTDTSVRRDAHDVLASIETTNLLILAELQHIRNAIGERSRSSVEITTGTNGKPFGIVCKAYQGSDILEPEAEAVRSFLRVRAELEQRLLDGWRQTVVTKGAAE